jgi:hypothetical protein
MLRVILFLALNCLLFSCGAEQDGQNYRDSTAGGPPDEHGGVHTNTQNRDTANTDSMNNSPQGAE